GRGRPEEHAERADEAAPPLLARPPRRRDAARPRRHVRAEARPEVPPAAPRLRREGAPPLQPGALDARDPGPPQGALPDGGERGADLGRDRRPRPALPAAAGPPASAELRRRLSRRATRQGP